MQEKPKEHHEKDRRKNKETTDNICSSKHTIPKWWSCGIRKRQETHKIWRAQLGAVGLAVLHLYLLAHSTDNFEM